MTLTLEERLARVEEATIKQWEFIDEIINYLRDKDPWFKLPGLEK